MASASLLSYKKNFRASPVLERFYTGGALVVAGDGTFVACACVDDVKIVDLATGLTTKTLKGDSETVTAIALSSSDGKSLFVASRSLQIKHWDLTSQSCLRTWKAHDAPVADMALDASGRLLATASADRRVMVWDVELGFCTHAFRGHKGVVSCVLFHPDIERLLLFSGGDDGTVRVWDLVKKVCNAVLDKHFSAVTSIALSTDGWSLLSAGRDKVVNVWDLRDYSHRTTVPVYEAIETVCVLPDGSGFPGSASSDGSLTANSMKPKKKSGGTSLRFLTVGEHGIVQVWNSDGAVCLYNQSVSDATIKASDKGDIKGGFTSAVLLSSQRELMCVTGDQRLLFYESVALENGEIALKLVKQLIGNNEEIIDLKFVGEGGQSLAVATNLEQVRVYDLTTLSCQQEMVGHTDIVLCLDSCVSVTGQPLLASAGKDHTARIWNALTGACLALATGHVAAVGAIAFSKKRRNFIVTGSSDRTIKLWSLEGVLGDGSTGDKPAKLSSQAVVAAHDKDINSIAVAPNDTLICSGSQDRTARIWRLPELVLVLTLKGHKRGVWDVEFSPVDQCVLTTSGDKTIKIWALSDGSCLKTFEGHTASVLKCAFLTCGTQLISAGADGLVKLWTIKTSECVNTFDHHDDKIWALAVSPTTKTLATGGGDSLINLWNDCTVDDEDEAIRKEEEEALRDQELSNALMDTNWVKAVKLAFTLQRPLKLFSVFTDLLRTQGGDVQLCEILQSLDKEHRQLLLEYIRDWNMKPKSCHIAQRVLFDVLSVVPPREILEVPGVEQFIEGIIPYAKRHLSRIDRLSRSTFLLDYTLARMSVLLPEENLASKDPSSWRLSVEDMKALPNASRPTPTNPHIKLSDEGLQKKDANENGYGSPTPMKDNNGSAQNKGRQTQISTASPEKSNGVSHKNADDMVKTGGEIDLRLGVEQEERDDDQPCDSPISTRKRPKRKKGMEATKTRMQSSRLSNKGKKHRTANS